MLTVGSFVLGFFPDEILWKGFRSLGDVTRLASIEFPGCDKRQRRDTMSVIRCDCALLVTLYNLRIVNKRPTVGDVNPRLTGRLNRLLNALCHGSHFRPREGSFIQNCGRSGSRAVKERMNAGVPLPCEMGRTQLKLQNARMNMPWSGIRWFVRSAQGWRLRNTGVGA